MAQSFDTQPMVLSGDPFPLVERFSTLPFGGFSVRVTPSGRSGCDIFVVCNLLSRSVQNAHGHFGNLEHRSNEIREFPSICRACPDVSQRF
jgi:hypothetical protein